MEVPDFTVVPCHTCQRKASERCVVQNGVASIETEGCHYTRIHKYDEEFGTQYAKGGVHLHGGIWPGHKEYNLLVDCDSENGCGSTAGKCCMTQSGNFAQAPHAARTRLYDHTYRQPMLDARAAQRKAEEEQRLEHARRHAEDLVREGRKAREVQEKADRAQRINSMVEHLEVTREFMGTDSMIRRFAEILIDNGWQWKKK